MVGAAAENKIEVIIGARDETAGALTGVEKRLQGVADNFTRAGRRMMVAGGIGVAAIALTVREFYKEEQVIAKLTHVLKTSVRATDEQIDALKRQAKTLQETGVVSDTTTMALQAQLATFMLNTDTISMMTPAILDMVVAEKGINATTGDMIGFGNAFGMAMEGNYAALTNRGFKLDENTKQIIENGTETEKAAAIVKYLNSVYEGMNEQMGKTSAGGMAALKNDLKDLQQEIGEVLAPIISKWVEKGQEELQWLKDIHPELRNFIAKTVLIGSVLLVAGAFLALFLGQMAQIGTFAIQAIKWFTALGTAGSINIGLMTVAMLKFMLVLAGAVALMETLMALKGLWEARKTRKEAEAEGMEADEIRRAMETGEITREEAMARFQALQGRGAAMRERVGRETWGMTGLERVGHEIGRYQEVFANISVTKEDEIGEKINESLKPIMAGA
jgi:hypothetical protein